MAIDTKALLETWRSSPCPIRVKPNEEGVRLIYGPERLDWIVLTPKHVNELIDKLTSALEESQSGE